MVASYEQLHPEELEEFFQVLLAALSRTLRDLALGPPDTHHREWILFHLMAFIEDEANVRQMDPELLKALEEFHQHLVLRAEPVDPPV